MLWCELHSPPPGERAITPRSHRRRPLRGYLLAWWAWATVALFPLLQIPVALGPGQPPAPLAVCQNHGSSGTHAQASATPAAPTGEKRGDNCPVCAFFSLSQHYAQVGVGLLAWWPPTPLVALPLTDPPRRLLAPSPTHQARAPPVV